MTNFDKPVPVPGVFSLQDFQNLASFSGAGKDNGFNVQSMFNNRDIELGFSPFDPSNQENTASPNYGFSSKDISNVGGVTRQKEKEEKKTYIPEVARKKPLNEKSQFEDMSFFDKAFSKDWWKTEVF